MKTVRIISIAALAMSLAACGKQNEDAAAPANTVAAEASAAPAAGGQNWTETVSVTADGGFRMGNPDAAVKLVEYASFTCPHCAAFEGEASEKLQAYVQKGTLSWEFRPFLLNAMDVAPSLLAGCQGPGPFFKLAEQLYADQPNWSMKYQGLAQAEIQRIQALPETQQFLALAKAGGLDQFFGARGLPAAKAEACLTDKAAIDKLVALRAIGTDRDGVTGTPTFLINGTNAKDTFDWASLEPKLKAAGA
ncbi:MAG: protein-disulfide isomerase-like protein [Sphingomonas bacterium]|jgi:protein-disulfide isomerase|nr:thioredoxin domain-containing protein [Sphingomonas bacterium]MDB5689058.1 protein-disulfide isomerase-like protein [Sphingomonas bacterium]